MAKNVEKEKILGWYFNTPLVWRVLTALVLGAVVGKVVGPSIVILEPFGRINLLSPE